MPRRKKKEHKRARGEGSVYFRKSDGRWLAVLPKWLDPERRPFTVASEDAGHAELDRRIEAARRGEVADDGTVAAALLRWTLDNQAGWKPSSRRTYKYQVLRCQPIAGYLHTELSSRIVQDWLNAMLADGLSLRYVRAVRGTLNAALGGTLPRTNLPKLPKTDPTAWNEREASLFLGLIRGHRFEAFYLTALWTGLRPGELLGLRWNDVDLEGALLRVRRTRAARSFGVPVRQAGQLYEGSPKSNRERDVDLPALVVRALKALQQFNPSGSAYVFANHERGGVPWSSSTVTNDLKALCEQARPKLTPISLKGTRHTTACLAIAGGLELPEVSDLLGHADSAITARSYISAFKRRRRRAVQVLEQVLGQAQEPPEEHLLQRIATEDGVR